MMRLLLFLLLLPVAFSLYTVQVADTSAGTSVILPTSEKNIDLIQIWFDSKPFKFTVEEKKVYDLPNSTFHYSLNGSNITKVRMVVNVGNKTPRYVYGYDGERWYEVSHSVRSDTNIEITGEQLYYAVTHSPVTIEVPVVENETENKTTSTTRTTQTRRLSDTPTESSSSGLPLIIAGVIIAIAAVFAGGMFLRKKLLEQKESESPKVTAAKFEKLTLRQKVEQLIAEQKSNGYIVNHLMANGYSLNEINQTFAQISGKKP